MEISIAERTFGGCSRSGLAVREFQRCCVVEIERYYIIRSDRRQAVATLTNNHSQFGYLAINSGMFVFKFLFNSVILDVAVSNTSVSFTT